MNKVVLIGNLTKDPELTTTPTGVSICRFTLAVNRGYASADGTRQTDFLNITCWRGLAENCAKFLSKGRKAAVFGSIQTRSYDAQDGTKRYATDIVADDVEFLSARGEGDGGQDYSAPPQSRGSNSKSPLGDLKPIDDDGDLPF